jgi:lysophospholipase L1-like esterase
VAALLAILLVETVSYVAARVLLPTGLLVAAPDTEGYADYLADRDPVLGWPAPGIFGSREFDRSGSRIVPAFPDPGQPSCVALYGDSFTWGDEVTPEYAYGNVLAQLLGCRVANYGVGGYGTDQAAIRYMRVIKDDAPLVILGHYSDNIIRNVNQLRDFIAGGKFGFKPRFVLNDGELQEVPLPTLSVDEYQAAADRAAELLPHEYFRPGDWGAAGIMQPPYSLAVAHAALHYRVIAALGGIRPTYASFYREDHPSRALQVTARLLQRAAAVASDRGQTFRVLLIPDYHDFVAARAGEPVAYEPLRQRLVAEGIAVIDPLDHFITRHAGRDWCELFVDCGNSHFNPAGYRLLAEAVHAALDADGVLSLPVAAD